MRSSVIDNTRGSALILALMAAGFSIIILSSLTPYVISHLDIATQTKITEMAASDAQDLKTIIENPDVLNASLAHTSNASALGCYLSTPKTCVSGIDLGPINVVDPTYKSGVSAGLKNSEFLSKASPQNSGLTASGQHCDTFDGTSGNRACPMRFEVFLVPEWTTPAQQQNPTLNIRVDAKVASNSQVRAVSSDIVNGGVATVLPPNLDLRCFQARMEYSATGSMSFVFDPSNSNVTQSEGITNIYEVSSRTNLQSLTGMYWGFRCSDDFTMMSCSGKTSSDSLSDYWGTAALAVVAGGNRHEATVVENGCFSSADLFPQYDYYPQPGLIGRCCRPY